jgi:hypothetical protein
MASGFSYAQLKAALWTASGARVHAVVDGLVVPGLAKKLAEAATRGWDCLQRGALSPERAERAAYLVELDPGAPFTDWLLAEAPGVHPGWGVVSVSDRALLPAREHYRSISDVLTPEGERRAWRWYDPEVLETVLPTLSASQLDELFALGQSLVVPGANAWSWHALERGVLASSTRALLRAAA